jgi:hypothetical protein
MNPWYAYRNKCQPGQIRLVIQWNLPRMFRPMF